MVSPPDDPTPALPPALLATLETIIVLETEIDDMSPELAGYLMDRLLAEGALDVHFTQIQMKKNRPAINLRVLARPAGEAALAEIIFRESTTFGLRRQAVERWALRREMKSVATVYGDVLVKVGYWGDEVLKAVPEYESCRALALARGCALAEVFDAARAGLASHNFIPDDRTAGKTR